MKRCSIAVTRMARHEALMMRCEAPIAHACGLRGSRAFIAGGWGRTLQGGNAQ